MRVSISINKEDKYVKQAHSQIEHQGRNACDCDIHGDTDNTEGKQIKRAMETLREKDLWSPEGGAAHQEELKS